MLVDPENLLVDVRMARTHAANLDQSEVLSHMLSGYLTR
jgi:hypothetical protein